MNSKTAKLLARASSALALVNVVKSEHDKQPKHRLSPDDQAAVIRASAGRTYELLKAQWYSTPRKQRGALRRRLAAISCQTKSAQAGAQARTHETQGAREVIA